MTALTDIIEQQAAMIAKMNPVKPALSFPFAEADAARKKHFDRLTTTPPTAPERKYFSGNVSI